MLLDRVHAPSFYSEAQRAAEVLTTWLPGATDVGQAAPTDACAMLVHPAFPLAAFVRACAAADSMRSRWRLWGMAKQFGVLWRDYRLYGWARDVFSVEPTRLKQMREEALAWQA
jgi:hypothetical protein